MKKHLTILFMLLSGLSIWAQVPSYMDTTALMGWYPFDGDANDYSTYRNDGSATSVTPTTDRNGNPSKAYNFNGSTSKIVLTKTAPLYTVPGHSISAWVYSNHPPVSGGHGGALFSNWYQNLTPANGVAPYFYLDAYPYWETTFNRSVYSSSVSTPIDSVTWKHIVFVRGQGSLGYNYRLYVDAQLVEEGGVPNSPDVSATYPSTIGAACVTAAGTGVTHSFDGKIDDMAFWQRPISPCEILDLYHSAKNSLVTTQPSNVTVQEGNTANISVGALAGATYQWKRYSVDNNSYVDVPANGGQYSGGTSATVTVSNTSIALNSNISYYCVVTLGLGSGQSNTTCSINSDTVKLTVTSATGIEETKAPGLALYPNPAAGIINLEVAPEIINAPYHILDIAGREVMTGKIESAKNIINISGLVTGSYFVRVENRNLRFAIK